MPPPLIGGALSNVLSDICLLCTSGVTRERRGLGRQKLAQRYSTSHMTQTPLSRSKVTRPLWLVILAGQQTQHGHTVMVTYPYAYRTYIVSPLAGLGGGISWRPPAYSLLHNAKPFIHYYGMFPSQVSIHLSHSGL